MFLVCFLTYLQPILLGNISSVGRNFLAEHVNRHSRQLIYKTETFNKSFIDFNNFNDFN